MAPRLSFHPASSPHAAIVAASLVCACALACAAETAPSADELARCAAMQEPLHSKDERLACYDALAAHAHPSLPPAEAAPVTPPQAKATQPANVGSTSGTTSLISLWELEPGTQGGLLRLTGFRPNYVLPLHVTNHINRAPQSPTQAVVEEPDYRTIEAKIQLSIRTKLAQNLFFDGANLWGAYTQQSLWQVYNSADSKPFRNTDYQPELMYMLPVPERLNGWLPGDWRWSYGQLGVVHQSNGQSDPLSRSWNRVYLGTGFERQNMNLQLRVWQRIHEDLADDNNPDIADYVGRSDLQFNWTPGQSTLSLLYRSNLKSLHRGSAQLEWAYPILRTPGEGELRWYVQLFSGYGETLTDYNFRQTSIGAGVTFLQF